MLGQRRRLFRKGVAGPKYADQQGVKDTTTRCVGIRQRAGCAVAVTKMRERKEKGMARKEEKKGKKLGPALWRFGTHRTGLLLCIVHRAFFDDLHCASTPNAFREDEYI